MYPLSPPTRRRVSSIGQVTNASRRRPRDTFQTLLTFRTFHTFLTFHTFQFSWCIRVVWQLVCIEEIDKFFNSVFLHKLILFEQLAAL